MIHTKDKKRLINFGKKFNSLSNKLSVGTHTLTPINFSEEREKFFSSNTYNPIYQYSPNNTSGLHKEIQALIEELDTITLPNSLRYYFRSALEALSTDIDLIDAIGTDRFAEIAADIYQYNQIKSESLLREAAHISFNEPGNCELQSAEEMADSFQKYIDQLGLDYTVTIDTFNDHIIRVGSRSLIVGSKVRRFCKNINRLIVHEIESHILQRHNLKMSDNPLLRVIPRPQVSLWGEGLAVYNEIHSGTITRGAFETYYYRLKAVENINRSFRQIYNLLTDYVSPEKAFMITYRVKRGMKETYNPGGFAKDASYLLGYKKVSEYIQDGGNIKFLYTSKYPHIGKLLLEHEMLEQKPVLLPAYMHTAKATNNYFPTSAPLI